MKKLLRLWNRGREASEGKLGIETRSVLTGIEIADERISMEQVNGPAPFASIVDVLLGLDVTEMDVIQNCDIQGWGTELNKHRVNPWAIRVREGMSGCRDYELWTKRPSCVFARKVASIHISCEGKLNHGIDPMWIGDFYYLAEKIIEDCPWFECQEYAEVKLLNPIELEWNSPGKDPFEEGRRVIRTLKRHPEKMIDGWGCYGVKWAEEFKKEFNIDTETTFNDLHENERIYEMIQDQNFRFLILNS